MATRNPLNWWKARASASPVAMAPLMLALSGRRPLLVRLARRRLLQQVRRQVTIRRAWLDVLSKRLDALEALLESAPDVAGDKDKEESFYNVAEDDLQREEEGERDLDRDEFEEEREESGAYDAAGRRRRSRGRGARGRPRRGGHE